MAKETSGETVSLGELLDVVGPRSYGPIIVILGFISISPLTVIPGATWVVAALTLIFTGQIVLGFNRPWLPEKLLSFEFQRKHLLDGAKGLRGWAEILDRILVQRMSFLTRQPFIRFAALMCVGAALITFPLGFVPLGPLLPGLTILVFGLGLAARDGVVVLLASASLVGSVLVLFRMVERWLASGGGIPFL